MLSAISGLIVLGATAEIYTTCVKRPFAIYTFSVLSFRIDWSPFKLD